MEELEALRKLVEDQNYESALVLIDEMDEMAKDDKINKIESFLEILLIHLIKQHAEKRSTNSWERSIANALRGIYKSNKRRESKGFYLNQNDLQNAIEESYSFALKEAAQESFGGAFSAKVLSEMIDSEAIKEESLNKILNYEV